MINCIAVKKKLVRQRLLRRREQDVSSLLHRLYSIKTTLLYVNYFSTYLQRKNVSRQSLFLQLIPASGLKKRADRAKARKTIPPMIVTKEETIDIFYWGACSMCVFKSSPVLTDIFWAIILPPITASPVHRQCPSVPPTATPNGS